MKKTVTLLLFLSLAIAGCQTPREARLAKQLKSKDPEVRRAAAMELKKVATAEALRLLELQADDPNFRVRRAVRDAIKSIRARTFLK